MVKAASDMDGEELKKEFEEQKLRIAECTEPKEENFGNRKKVLTIVYLGVKWETYAKTRN